MIIKPHQLVRLFNIKCCRVRSFYPSVLLNTRWLHSQSIIPAVDTTLTGRFNRYIVDLHPELSAASTVDQLAEQDVAHLSHSDLLAITIGWSRQAPLRVHQRGAYAPAMQRLCATYESGQPKGDFLAICHLLGAAKKRGSSAQLLDAFMRRHFNKYADTMSDIELAIVAAASYRTAIRVQANHGRHFERAVLRMQAEERLDMALVVTFVKSLRLARFRSESVAQTLSNWIVTGRIETASDPLQFRHIAHLLTFYASNRFDEPAAVQWLTERALRLIRDDYADRFRGKRAPIDMRAKDFAMVLWSLAQLNAGHRISDADLLDIGAIIREKCADGEFRRDFDGLVDVTLSLWMIGLRSRALVKALFDRPSSIAVPVPAANRVKLESRKRLLLCCVQSEQPDWFEALPVDDRRDVCVARRPAKEYLLRNTPNLRHLRGVLQRRSLGETANITLVQPIREINIAGLLLETEDNIRLFVEVPEEHTMLSDGCTPFGVLALKLRLLRANGQLAVLVNPLELNDDEDIASGIIAAELTAIRSHNKTTD